MKHLIFILSLFIGFSVKAQYNPTLGNVSNNATGYSQQTPSDMRSQYFDVPFQKYRDFASRTEAVTYLTLTKYRANGSPIFIHEGGSLVNAVWIGGQRRIYIFKDSTDLNSLVPWSEVTSVNGQKGDVIIGNSDSLKHLPVDTSAAPRNNYLLTFDSTLHKWKLTAPSSSYTAGTGILISGNTISGDNTTALWNANTFRGRSISTAVPNVGNIYKWSGVSWVPSPDLSALDTAYFSNDTLYLVGNSDTSIVVLNDFNVLNDHFNVEADSLGTMHFEVENTGNPSPKTGIDLNLDSISIHADNIHYTQIVNKADSLKLIYANNAAVKKYIKLDTAAITIVDNINSFGQKYGADYSANGKANPRWLPDIAAVRSAIGDSSGNYIKNDTTIVQNGGFKLNGWTQQDTVKITSNVSGGFWSIKKSALLANRLSFFHTNPLNNYYSDEKVLFKNGGGGIAVSGINNDSPGWGWMDKSYSTDPYSCFFVYSFNRIGYLNWRNVTSSYNFSPSGSTILLSYDSAGNIIQPQPNGSFTTYGLDNYNSNIAGSYTSRSKTDKNYVDSSISAGVGGLTASNGLSKVTNDIQLGGSLTTSTSINLSGNTFSLLGNGGNEFLTVDDSTQIIGDEFGSSHGLGLYIDNRNTLRTLQLGDIAGAGNSSLLTIEDITGKLNYGSSGNNKFTVTNTGFGIKTSTPSQALQVHGQVQIDTLTNGTAGTDSVVLVHNGVLTKSAAANFASPYTFSTGLTNTSGTITNNLTTGVLGGQTITGGINSSDNITITSTNHSVKGNIWFGTSLSTFNENTGRWGLGTTSPSAIVTIGAGSAAAGAAPLKFTSGTPTTTPEVGSIQFSNGLFIADSSNSKRDTIATRSWVNNGVASGRYTPTITNGTNAAASTARQCQYMRVGNVVTVSGTFNLQVTTSLTKTIINISLPIASTLSSVNNLAGTAETDVTGTSTVAQCFYTRADISNNNAQLTGQFNAAMSNPSEVAFSFTYLIQ